MIFDNESRVEKDPRGAERVFAAVSIIGSRGLDSL